MSKKEYQKAAVSIPAAVTIGTVTSLAVMLVGAVAVSLLIANETINSDSVGYGILVVTLISSMVGNALSLLLAQKKLLVVSLCTSGAFGIVLLSITALFFGGQYSGVPVTFLVIFGGGAGTILMTWKLIIKTKSYHRKVKL